MAYATGRIIHDADAHVMETPDWLAPWADPDIRPKLRPLFMTNSPDAGSDEWDRLRALHRKEWFRSGAEAELMTRKNWHALGSFLKEDRPAALDALGFASQLVFSTWCGDVLWRAEHGDDLDLAYGMATAHNRAMLDFCSVDPRLLAVAYVPLADLDRAAPFARDVIAAGARALLVASACPPGHSPSHIRLDGVWAAAQEAGVPIVFHVGGGGRLLDPSYFNNGGPPIPDFHGGDGNFKSVDYLAIPYPVMQTVGTLVIDGVFHRFPDLRFGAIEQGATWLPFLMKNLDSAHEAFRKNEDRLRALDLRPSEYLRRQLRVTPYPHEDAGWVMQQAGWETCLFSSDYPHVEGGRHPLGRFERSLGDLPEDARDRFYRRNFEDLMGPALAGIPTPAVPA